MSEMTIETTRRWRHGAVRFNGRTGSLVVGGLGVLILLGVTLAAPLLGSIGIASDFGARLLPPNASHWFGTDFMGRDMLARTIHGLAVSLWVGLIASAVSTAIAAGLALAATVGGKHADAIVSFFVDTAMGLPHLVLLILIAFALGGGTTAVVIAVSITHWPRLTRILRAEILQLREAEYVTMSRRFGKSWWFIGRSHMLPHLLPQLLVGLVLMFPHAIMHEAGLTFLGFGLEPSKPAIGVLLSESMRELTSGKWWLGLFPGLSLLIMVLCMDAIGTGLRKILDPRTSQE